MPEWTESDKEHELKVREIRKLLAAPVNWGQDADPLKDLERLIEGMGGPKRRSIDFICGLHGQQGLVSINFGGLTLECGCRIESVSGKWNFTTLEDRGGYNAE